MDYDLKITGGTIIDGTGSKARSGDLAIKDGKIVAVGEAKGSAHEIIEAKGRVVAPGFIDVHTHYDAQVLWDRMLTISPWHGVTSVVMGNCGFGVAPTRPEHRELILQTLEKVEGMNLATLEKGLGDWQFESYEEYLDLIAERGTIINVGSLLGHTPLRLYVMGEEATERPATDAEVAQMRNLLRGAIKAGALGLATSKSLNHYGAKGKPVPSRAAELSEIKALVSVLAEEKKGLLQVAAGPELFLREYAEIAEQTSRTITWTALLTGLQGEMAQDQVLIDSEPLWKKGLKIVPQVSCRPLNFEFDFIEPFLFGSMPLFAAIAAADLEGKKKIYSSPEFRRAFRSAGPEEGLQFVPKWSTAYISFCPAERPLEEQNLESVARTRGLHPIDLALDLALASDLKARFRMAVVNDDADALAQLLLRDEMVLGLSDAGAHASQLCDACFSTDLLGRWVRERKVMTLERAVWMLSGRPAEVFSIIDRGRLEPELAADVTIFDPDKVGSSDLFRVYDMPGGQDRLVAEAFGIDSVIVNGRPIRREGRDTLSPNGPLPGRILRNGHA